MINELKKASHKVKQKMRLGELKRAVKNTRDVDNYLHHLEHLVQSHHLRVLAEIDELRVSTRKRSERLVQDLDAILKYRTDQLQTLISRKPSYISNGKFVLFSCPFMELVIPSEDAGLIAYIEKHGAEFIEPGTRQVIKRSLKPGDVAVDIGANLGIHTVTMGYAVGESGQVFAFEPTPNVVAALKYTLLLSGLRHVQIVAKAVLDESKPVKLYSFNHSPENSVFPAFDVDPKSVFSIEVPAVSLDSFFAPGSRVDFVKIDVEGAEPLVYQGMQRVIEENPQIKIVMEMSPSHFLRAGTNFKTFFDTLTQQGFIVQAIDEESGDTEICSREQIADVDTLNVLIQKTPTPIANGS